MGVCSSAMCQPNSNTYQTEYSIKSALIRSLKPYEEEEWYYDIKQIILRYNFQDIERIRYSYPVRETVRFSKQQNGEEMETKYNRFANMSAERKGKQLELMLSKAYMIIDEQDMPHNNSKLLLPEIASRNLFTSSMNASVIGSIEDPESMKRRNQKLRTYDPVVLQSLEGFVNFCKQLQTQIFVRESVFYSILLSFKSSIVQACRSLTQIKSNEGTFAIRQRVSSSCNRFLYFLIESISLIYNIPKIQQRQQQKCFYSQTNLYTLTTSLLFNQKQFHDMLKKLYNFSIRKQIQKLKQAPHLSQQKYPLPLEFSLDNKTLKYMKIDKSSSSVDLQQKPLASLFKTTSLNDEPYSKCVKMLSQIPNTNQPIGQLKIIYQTGLRINKQIQRFYKQYYIPVPRIDAEKLLQIVKNILARCQNIDHIITQIVLMKDFVHNYYKISKKGAYLTPFLVAIDESYKI